MNAAVKTYYDELAPNYDEDRFANSYGRYLDAQEREVLGRLLTQQTDQLSLDVACGTGRLLNYSTHGADISPAMIEQARKKFPDKSLVVASATELPFADNYFDQVTAFHLIMHLDKTQATVVFTELLRVLKPGGRLIIDFPSAARRRLTSYRAKNWHAANSYTKVELRSAIGDQASNYRFEGVAFLPVHRLPARWRPFLRRVDNCFCRSFLKVYASYLVVSMQKPCI
ncbi:MAG: class I SAM-dependent methyltransferase [Bacteroidota bacterium]